MFNTLVESRAIRTRSTKSTLASLVFHAAILAIAVSATVRTVEATLPPKPSDEIIYVPTRTPPPPTPDLLPPRPDAPPSAPLPNIAVPLFTPKELPPIDYSAPVIPVDDIRIGGPGALTSPYAPASSTPYVPGNVVDVGAVERIPSLIGNARAPRYPDALRQSNIDGKVSVRFVVDTLGRAEMDGLTIVETSHQLFAEAVKSALVFYRFTPGEVGGHKVRTMVQIPFTFSLTK
ncbi:MAG: energy transducer TonB [bacterium]